MGCGEGVTAVPPPHPTTKKNGRHCQRPCPHIHLLRLAETGQRPYPPTKSTAVIADGRAPRFTPCARPNPADGRTPTTKARPSLPTAVPPHSPPTPGRNRPTAVPPTKSTAVIADGRAPRFTPCARPNPANGRTPPQKARPSLPTAVPQIHSLRQAQPG
ncbi:MAG: hypothetical protein HS099_03410 [Ardenticatenaceae bacterium]|nr:hypothetical protein [Ardenticatenaceae bacterium]